MPAFNDEIKSFGIINSHNCFPIIISQTQLLASGYLKRKNKSLFHSIYLYKIAYKGLLHIILTHSTDYKKQITPFLLQMKLILFLVPDYLLQISLYQLQINNFLLQISPYLLLINTYLLQVSAYLLRISAYLLGINTYQIQKNGSITSPNLNLSYQSAIIKLNSPYLSSNGSKNNKFLLLA